MRGLGLVGAIALLFGLASYRVTEHLGAFALVNLGLGGLALLGMLGAELRRLRTLTTPPARRLLAKGLLRLAIALVVAVALERGAARSGIQLDWTFEQRFEPSEAMRSRLRELDPAVTALLFYDPEDPRIRRSRLMLDTLAKLSDGGLRSQTRRLADHPDEADRYEVGTSNTVVLVAGNRYETVDRPGEGTLYEALQRLDRRAHGSLVILRGAGDGDPERGDELGFSGFAAALETEGYRVRSVVSAAMSEVPADAGAVIVLAPERRLPEAALAALRRHLAAGGRLVALLEPGRASGIEEILAEWGIHAPPALVVDPASAPVGEHGAEGIDVVAYNYEGHPVTRGLDRGRMTFFPGVRPFDLRKPRVDDELKRVVLSSPSAFRTPELAWLTRASGRPEPGAAEPSDYQTLVAVGRYPREAGETRIVAFGDSGFASNQHLRTLYDLDLAMNAVHWATQHEAEITLRPKLLRTTVQFPVPIGSSVEALYGVGLLLPELLLIAGALVWLRRRNG